MWTLRMSGDFLQQIHKDRRRKENPYAYLMGDGTYDALPALSTTRSRTINDPEGVDSASDLHSLRRAANDSQPRSRKGIAALVRELHSLLWRSRRALFPDRRHVDPLELLDPILTLRFLGFECNLVESLGQYALEGQNVEVAGTVDASGRSVEVSRQFEPPVRKFTAAHELGHAILHPAQALHRDRAFDGTQLRDPRDRTEWEADVFATYFLMPDKLVRARFEALFRTSEFVLNEETAFALNAGDIEELRARYIETRHLSRLLAKTTYYDGCHFDSLAQQFGVSFEAMAIRLEELRLIKL